MELHYLIDRSLRRVKQSYALPLLGIATILTAIISPISFAKANDSSDLPAYISIGAGYYDVLDDDNAATLRLEFRTNYNLYKNIRPFITFEDTTEGSYFIGTGLYRDFYLSDRFYLTPSFAVNYYENGSADLDLGHHVEFRSQIELGYEFNNRSRVSMGLSHYSNASLSESNPGTEVLSIQYHIPISQ